MSTKLTNRSFLNSHFKLQMKVDAVWAFIWRALALLSLVLGSTFSANAQVVVRPEVAKSLKAAQDALSAGQAENAVTLAQQTLSLPGITAAEKPFIQRTLAIASLQAKNFPLAVLTLEAMLQDMP